MNIGDTVQVIVQKDEWNPFFGMEGQIEQIDPHNTDGDFWGVRFPDERVLFFFWADELTVMQKGASN